ncbi:MAG: HAD family hydrolase [Clostridia bacterium]|nr:HAD family hydrolase [Clostridia bacterium]
MIYTHIIWDFNGTLFDDVEAGILSVNKMLSDRGLKTISDKEAYRRVFKFPIIDYYKDIGFDFDAEPYEVLAPIWVELYNKYSLDSRLHEGAAEMLEYFKREGVTQILLSATELNMLKGQIKYLGIERCFETVLGLGNIHAYSKRELAVEWRRKNPEARPLVIGDTEHDFDVARAIDAECVLVCNGHQSRDILEKYGCKLCDDLYNVMEWLKSKNR